MELLRYNPKGNATCPPIDLLQIAFCTWVQVHSRCIFLILVFLQHPVSYSLQHCEQTTTLKHVNNTNQQANTGLFHSNGRTLVHRNRLISHFPSVLSNRRGCCGPSHRTKIIFGKHPPVDNVSESSVTDETVSDTSSGPRVRRIDPS